MRVLLLLLAPVAVHGHARWKCPLPRDVNDEMGNHEAFMNTGNKRGPCGPFSGKENWGRGPVATLKPGLQTLTWEESISHAGAPFRIAILDENEEAKVVLLNHIPHWDASKPTPGKEATYTQYRMTVNIPDVACDKCSLQLLYVMTDKTTRCTNSTAVCDLYMDDTECSGRLDKSQPKCQGASTDEPCKRANTCFSSYWSCASVVMKGSVPIAQARVAPPRDWPFANMPNMSFGVERGNWTNGWLSVANLPKAYITIAGDDLCVVANVTAPALPTQTKPTRGLRQTLTV